MELRIKHLAAYLPYGLKVQHNYKPSFDKIIIREVKLECLSNECCTFSLGQDWYFDDEENECEIKPILRPLSKLTELMPNNDVSYVSYLWYEVVSTDSYSFCKDDFYENCSLGDIDLLPIKVYQQLCEWHFDIFGLIDAGLAVEMEG